MMETAKERLRRVMRYSRPYRRKLTGSRWPIALALLVLIVVIIAVSVLGGRGATEVIESYANWIKDWTSSP